MTFITLGPAKGGEATACTLFVSPASGARSWPTSVLAVCPISEPLAGSAFAGVGGGPTNGFTGGAMDGAADEGEKGFTEEGARVPDFCVEGAGHAVINGLPDEGADVSRPVVFLGVTLTGFPAFSTRSFNSADGGSEYSSFLFVKSE